jgi:hypothetical protein
MGRFSALMPNCANLFFGDMAIFEAIFHQINGFSVEASKLA